MQNRTLLKYDLIAVGIFFFYCLVFAVTRLIISPNMELDESEQFLYGTAFHWGYSTQAPLYTWIVKTLSTFLGHTIITLVVLKYLLIFLFYVFFFKICRYFWDSRISLCVTGSLMLFPLYLYEFNRDLSHTVLVTVMGVITCLLYLKVLSTKKLIYYMLIGISIGFGILSKYNFLFLVLLLLLASVSSKEGRAIIINKRIFITILFSILIISPHIIWLIQNDYPSIWYGMNESSPGRLDRYQSIKVLSVFASPYIQIAGFFLLFIIFFFPFLSKNLKTLDAKVRFIRWVALYGLLLPIVVIFILQTGHFSTRWLAPIYFIIPLAAFSFLRLDGGNNRLKYFGGLCASMGLVVLFIRIIVGFMPDVTGKTERIHIPFKDLSVQIHTFLQERGINKEMPFIIITDDSHIAANLAVYLPDLQFIDLKSSGRDKAAIKQIIDKQGIFIWKVRENGEIVPRNYHENIYSDESFYLQAHYLHSKYSSYTLGISFIEKLE